MLLLPAKWDKSGDRSLSIFGKRFWGPVNGGITKIQVTYILGSR